MAAGPTTSTQIVMTTTLSHQETAIRFLPTLAGSAWPTLDLSDYERGLAL